MKSHTAIARTIGRGGILCLGAAALIGISIAPATGQSGTDRATAPEFDHPADLPWKALVQSRLGLSDSTLTTLDVPAVPGQPFSVDVPLDGRTFTLDLVPHSVRAGGYELLVQLADGTMVSHPAGPVNTSRGSVRGNPASFVTASILEDGLHVMIDRGDGNRFWIEPVAELVPVGAARYVVYGDDDILPTAGQCGMLDADLPEFGDLANIDAAAHLPGRKPGLIDAAGSGTLAGTGLCVAELACDADTEYFNDYGSVANVEARINSVVNTVNSQYETQTNITHQITTIIVRTGSDPYTSTNPETRLCQFITEWTNNQQGVQRDVAHLFTGATIDGSTIGIAADIGATGICVTQGSCTGGQFGTQGSYCLAQSDFNNNFASATDLTAHELGHLWGAFHCSCPSNTMNSSITSTNNFSQGTINSITNYRDTRTCLTGGCSGGPQLPPNDSCATPTVIPCTTSETLNNSTATPTSGQSDSELPAGSPSCQWQGTPTNVHNTLWYEFVADDTSVQIETCATTAIQDTILALYAGSCGSLTELACSEDACGGSTYMSSICFNGLTPGASYLVMVGNPGGWTGSTGGQIVLDLTCPCPATGPVAGACCLPGGGCSAPETPTSCAAAGGTFQGAGTTCGGVSCAPGAGACCLGGGACAVDTASGCASSGGAYQGDGTDCVDTDGDGTADLCDGCPNDPGKTSPGACGCGTPDTDTDGDGTPDCTDGCPSDPGKTAPGDCGCGLPDTDTDGDGTPDCTDGCPSDPGKTAPGDCGCGLPDTDTDGDGVADCVDGCPSDPGKTAPGDCGCGTPDTDSDGDGTPDCNDGCPNDPGKTAPGACGCGTPDTDADMNGTPDCNDIGACCTGTTCSVVTQASCDAAGGVYQGTGTNCAGDPCAAADVDNVATSDLSTGFGAVTGGSFVTTHAQDDTSEAIREEQSGGNPAKRRSRLQHTWTFNVAAGTGYQFFVDAFHTPNSENDHFVFSYSTDNSAYAEMLTVTKTADNDGLQSYTFPSDVSGTLYVRVEDTNRSQGNSALDTIFIDEMFVRTTTGGGDLIPPAAPAALTATGGDGIVTLDWADNGEGDLDGYNVFRATASGGPYTKLNAGLVAPSAYADTAVTNGTTYFYVVTAVDVAGNESADSGTASATPVGSGTMTMSVGSIVVQTQNLGGGQKQGRADVTILDQGGSPVAGALVTGTFTGNIPGLPEQATAQTNASGVATLLTTASKKGSVAIQFCVDDVTEGSHTYVSGGNAETCDVN